MEIMSLISRGLNLSADNMNEVFNKPMTLCWFCKKATCSGCSWSSKFEPVEGWKAEPSHILLHSGRYDKYNVKTKKKIISSYTVISCPEFLEG